MVDEEWFTVEEVAEHLKVNEETVRRWIRKGEMPVLALGTPKAGYRISRQVLDDFIRARHGVVGKIAA